MPSPFPGMDPYLEHPQSWPNFHHRLITAIAIDLAPQLRPKYRVVVDEVIYQTRGQDSLLVGIPDVAVQQFVRPLASVSSPVEGGVPVAQPLEVELAISEVMRQGYLEVWEVATSQVVTVIEVLSPTNKRPGECRRTYEAKRQLLLASATNLVEMDIYDQSEYDLVVNYQANPIPPLTDEDNTWLNEWLQQRGMR